MRSLNLNKTSLWRVDINSKTEIKDDDGYFTGDYVIEYSTPTKIALHLYPSNSEITKKLFGIDDSFDMIANSNEIVLNQDTLLFLSEPSDNYDSTYDYSVSSISKSLNSYNYGLRGRV